MLLLLVPLSHTHIHPVRDRKDPKTPTAVSPHAARPQPPLCAPGKALFSFWCPPSLLRALLFFLMLRSQPQFSMPSAACRRFRRPCFCYAAATAGCWLLRSIPRSACCWRRLALAPLAAAGLVPAPALFFTHSAPPPLRLSCCCLVSDGPRAVGGATAPAPPPRCLSICLCLSVCLSGLPASWLGRAGRRTAGAAAAEIKPS